MMGWITDQLQMRRDRRILDLESQLDAKDRVIAVQQAEIESLAAVIARDRARIQAEGAAYARQQAEAEGLTNERRTEAGVR